MVVNLDAIARALPDVERGVACAGTPLESRTYLVRRKSFLFVGKKDARLKLGGSTSEAEKLGFAVGANGWVKLALDALPEATVLKRWVAESHALVAPITVPKGGAGVETAPKWKSVARRSGGSASA